MNSGTRRIDLQSVLRLVATPFRKDRADRRQARDMVITSVWSRRTKWIVAIATILVGIAILWGARNMLAPFIWAAIIAYLFTPLVSFAKRRIGVPRPVLVLIVYAIGINVIFWTFWIISRPLAGELERFSEGVTSLASWIEEQITGTDAIEVFGQTIQVDYVVEELADPVRALAQQLSGRLVELTFGIIETLFNIILTLVAAFYLVLAGPRLLRRVISLVPDPHRPEVESVVGRLDDVLHGFIRGQLLVILIMGTIIYIGLAIIGIPFALVFGIAAGFLELIPVFGPIVAAIPPIALAFFGANAFGWPGWLAALVVASMYFILTHLEDYLLTPNVIGRIINIHPFVALFALFAGATIWGVNGVILALPAAAMGRVVLTYVYRKLIASSPPEARAGNPPPAMGNPAE